MGLRILYGANGAGLGHATRSQVVAEALLARHDVRVVTSGGALAYLRERLPRVEQVFGPSFAMDHGEIAAGRAAADNLARRRASAARPCGTGTRSSTCGGRTSVVTDFEPLAGLYARTAHVPLVSVDNSHMIDRCRHDEGIVGDAHADFADRAAVTPRDGADGGRLRHHDLLPAAAAARADAARAPVLRPEVLAAAPERGDHLLVYSGGEPGTARGAAARAGCRARVYGMRDAAGGRRDGTGAVDVPPALRDGFLEDLRTARAVDHRRRILPRSARRSRCASRCSRCRCTGSSSRR